MRDGGCIQSHPGIFYDSCLTTSQKMMGTGWKYYIEYVPLSQCSLLGPRMLASKLGLSRIRLMRRQRTRTRMLVLRRYGSLETMRWCGRKTQRKHFRFRRGGRDSRYEPPRPSSGFSHAKSDTTDPPAAIRPYMTRTRLASPAPLSPLPRDASLKRPCQPHRIRLRGHPLR